MSRSPPAQRREQENGVLAAQQAVMDGISFVRKIRDEGVEYPPIGAFVGFTLTKVEKGYLEAVGTPTAAHYNPLGVVHGGFSSTMMDLALGLVSITTMPSMENHVTTADLTLRYLRPIFASTGQMTVAASVLHAGKRTIVAEASLRGGDQKLYTLAQSTLLVVARRAPESVGTPDR
jgi:uncharacterized protein (TIGR00369 family)